MTLPEYYQTTAVPAFAVLVAGGAICLALRRKSAATRQLVCGAALVGALLVALVPFLPNEARPVLPQQIQSRIQQPRLQLLPLQPEAAAQPNDQTSLVPSRLDFSAVLTSVAIAVTSLLALRLAGSIVGAARLRKRAQPASTRLRSMAEAEVRVVESLSSPVALGGFKPLILLPAEAEGWPEDRLRAVLIHEQAHLRNGDPNWQLLAEITCLVHWFNPFAWVLRDAMRREAERAADDAVLMSGVRPSDYAGFLAAFAARMGPRRQPIAWTAFARKAGLKGRIQAILSPHSRRKPMRKTSRIAAVLTVAAAVYVISAFAYPQVKGVSNPTSPYDDVRQGRTIPATSENGYVGTLADGRKVEVLQISRQSAQGKYLVWKPDGTPIPPADQIKLRYHPLGVLDEHTRYVVVRFPERKGGSIEPSPGCGSGAADPRSPTVKVFSGGGIISRKDGYITCVSYVGTPKEDGEILSIGFSLADGPWTDMGPVAKGTDGMEGVRVWEATKPLPQDDSTFIWEQSYKGPATVVEFALRTTEIVDSLKVVPVFQDPNKEHDPNLERGAFGGYTDSHFEARYYFGYPQSEIKEFRLLQRAGLNCELHEIALNPAGGPRR